MSEFKSRRKQQFRKKGDNSAVEEDGAPAASSPPSTPSSTTATTPTPTPTHTTSTTATPATPATPTTPPSTSTPTNGTKNETKSEKPKPTLLSFGDDEAEEEFQVKRTNKSKKMTKEVKESKEKPKRELYVPPVVSTATAAHGVTSGEYTPEKMEELRKNAMAYSKPKQEAPSSTEKEPEIPTAAQIHAARERRKGMREGKDGFIPLEDGEKSDKGNKGRLVREEGDDDDSADEEGRGSGTRIDFGSIKKGGKEIIDVEDDAEDDEELKRWEMDRIRKGVGAQEMKRKDLVDKARTNKSPARAGLDLTRKSTVTIDTITKDIKSTLAGLKEAHRAHTAQLDRVKDELRTAQNSSESMQDSLKQGADEYSFFAGMKIYVADLLDCLGAKAELVERAEDKQLAAYRVRNAKNRTHAQRKLDAVAQEMKEISEEAAGYGKGPAKARPKREEKKKKERGAEEGWSSDEESAEVNAEFEEALKEVKVLASEVFADVDEQYCTIPVIKGKFEKWKSEYSNTYRQAYISLSMPQLFSPFVRLQLLARDPLRAGLGEMPWFTDLLTFGVQETTDADDEDNFLIPRLVEKVVVPRVQDALSHAWNPQSRKRNTQAIQSVQEVLEYGDAFTGNTKELFVGVLGGLQTAVQELHIPMYHFPKDKDIGSTLPWEFSCRMMWRGIKLLKNITAWHEVLAAAPLQQLAIDNLITTKLLPFVRTLRDSNTELFLDAYESITKCLPAAWTTNVKSEEENGRVKREAGTVPANLAIFHDPLLTVTRKLSEEDSRERNKNSNNSKEGSERRGRLLASAVRSLARLGDTDTADLMARASGIKL